MDKKNRHFSTKFGHCIQAFQIFVRNLKTNFKLFKSQTTKEITSFYSFRTFKCNFIHSQAQKCFNLLFKMDEIRNLRQQNSSSAVWAGLTDIFTSSSRKFPNDLQVHLSVLISVLSVSNFNSKIII